MKQSNATKDFFTASVDLNQLEKIIGYRFNDRELLKRALIHPSTINQKNNKIKHFDTYDRDEFLGDSLLSFVVSDLLYRACPYDTPHELSLKRVSLIRNDALAKISKDLKLTNFVFGVSQMWSPTTTKMHADVVESLIGAVYIDGGLHESADLIKRLMPAQILKLTVTGFEAKTGEAAKKQDAKRIAAKKMLEVIQP